MFTIILRFVTKPAEEEYNPLVNASVYGRPVRAGQALGSCRSDYPRSSDRGAIRFTDGNCPGLIALALGHHSILRAAAVKRGWRRESPPGS
jgi:hypothetical protein